MAACMAQYQHYAPSQMFEGFEDVLLVVGGENAGGAVLAWIGWRQGTEIFRLGRRRHEVKERRR